MKTLGYMKVVLLPLMILATTTGSSPASQIPNKLNISEENASCKKENLKEVVTSESDWKRYYESSDDLKRDIKKLEKTLSEEKFSPSTQPLEK